MRQYGGTAGRIENSQVGVFLALASARGRALIDHERYLPKSWCEDEDRLRAAVLPEATAQDLAIAAGQRWSIECCFESAKPETGLDDYEVRSWHGWYRHVTLSMAALALRSVIRAAANNAPSKKVLLRISYWRIGPVGPV